MSEGKRVIGYARVSTQEQAEVGVSLAAQRERIEGYAKLYGLELVALVEDAGASAKTLERPGLQAALAALRRGEADAILVAKLDRLTRSVRDLGDLLDGALKSKGLVSVAEQIDTGTAGGRLVLNVLASSTSAAGESGWARSPTAGAWPRTAYTWPRWRPSRP